MIRYDPWHFDMPHICLIIYQTMLKFVRMIFLQEVSLLNIVYLTSKITNQRKLPRWIPHLSHGLFMGFSHFHSSDVPLIFNLRTGNISLQFHVNYFSSVSSVERKMIP
jgi:hypothetical protein